VSGKEGRQEEQVHPSFDLSVESGQSFLTGDESVASRLWKIWRLQCIEARILFRSPRRADVLQFRDTSPWLI